jgi:EAL domain-containing protein (putative c-di-GMP-specific phosphodiesterase class I)
MGLALGTTNEADFDAAAAPLPLSERFKPFGEKPLRTFLLVVALPALLLYASGALVLLFTLVMMATEIDHQEAERNVTAMAAALDSLINGLSEAVADEGTWNEAYLNVVVQPDPAWMDATWGATARLGTTYNDVMVTDQSGDIVFGENNLGPIRGDVAERYPAAEGMLSELDEAIRLSGDAAVAAHFAADAESTVALAAISIHRSTPGENNVPREHRRILWIVKRITPGILQDIALRYQMPIARMVTEVAPGESSLDLTDVNGNVAGTLAWTPEHPGDLAFRHAAATAFAIYCGLGVILLIGLNAMRRAMMRRSASLSIAFAERPLGGAVPLAAMASDGPTEVAEEELVYSAIDGVAASAFTIDYQPVLDLRAQTMVSVETLLRWTRADNLLVLQEDLSPRECAAMMERAAIMALRHAAGELAPLLGVKLSLTVTPQQLMNSVFIEKVVGTLGATNFQMRRLQLSVDATLLPGADRLAPGLAELRRMGVAVALANFTLSERTIQYVRAGFADRICLAPHMIAGIDADPVRLKLVETTMEAARSVGYEITAPNVQRKEEAAKLLRLGCRDFRGPLLAPPMSIAALTALILAPAQPEAVKQAG